MQKAVFIRVVGDAQAFQSQADPCNFHRCDAGISIIEPETAVCQLEGLNAEIFEGSFKQVVDATQFFGEGDGVATGGRGCSYDANMGAIYEDGVDDQPAFPNDPEDRAHRAFDLPGRDRIGLFAFFSGEESIIGECEPVCFEPVVNPLGPQVYCPVRFFEQKLPDEVLRMSDEPKVGPSGTECQQDQDDGRYLKCGLQCAFSDFSVGDLLHNSAI